MDDVTSGATGAARARLDRLAADAKAKAERYQAMRTQTQQVSVSASAPDGVVIATVDSGGNVTDLRVSDQIRELSGDRIASLVLTTIRQAQAKLPERLREIMADTIGGDQRTIDTIVGNYEARFPQPQDEQSTEPERPDRELHIGRAEDDAERTTPPVRPPARPAPGANTDEDDWANQSIMRSKRQGG